MHPESVLIPMITEKTGRYEYSGDIFSRLLRDRIIFLGTPIDDMVANTIIAQLLFCAADNPEKNIHLYINSPGGIVSSGLAIYDTIQYIPPKVQTICLGMAGSMAAILLASGEPGMRTALPHARIMLHQPVGGIQGQTSDIEIHAREIIKLKKSLNEILVTHTGQELEQIAKDTERDYYMNPEEAKEYGLLDEVLVPASDETVSGDE